MDRKIVYPGAVPLDTDILTPERNAMIGLGWLIQSVFGTATGVAGLECNPTSPASMTVNVTQGVIWAQETIEATSFGSLNTDTSPLMKMGILPEAAGTNFTLTAPATSGQSINYLIEATFQELDGVPVVLPYVNPSNPAQPYSGPSNNGTAQNTVRQQLVELQLKAGAAANTGTQVTPATDTGYVPLYVITVNYGQTTVTASSIVTAPGAPFNGGPFAPYQQVSWNAGSPPSGVDYNLPVGGTAIISYNSAANIPLNIKTTQGIYQVRVFTYATNTTNADISLNPNNTTYTGAISNFTTNSADSNVSSFGTATAGAGLTTITASPYLGNIPVVGTSVGSAFFVDLFNGPSSSDTINDKGPWNIDYSICTFTAGKFLKAIGAITGGGSSAFGKWNDTTTVWSSLGTIVDPNATSMSGVVIVTRIA